MKIIFILICASIAFAADSEIRHGSSPLGKLINGQPIENENYKFTASFRRQNIHFCTASLLSNKHALTTATCLRDFLTEREIPDFDLYTIRAGRIDLPGESVVLSIEEVKTHSRFKFNVSKCIYNIGIVTMRDNHLTESKYVGWGFVKLPLGVAGVKEAEVTRWVNIHGTRSKDGEDNYTLIVNTVKALKKYECGFNRNSPIICAQSVTGDLFFSKEDIGAPLIEGIFIRGVLAFIPDDLNKPVTFINTRKSFGELYRLTSECTIRHRLILPRKRAKNDPIFTNFPLDRMVKFRRDDAETNDKIN